MLPTSGYLASLRALAPCVVLHGMPLEWLRSGCNCNGVLLSCLMAHGMPHNTVMYTVHKHRENRNPSREARAAPVL